MFTLSDLDSAIAEAATFGTFNHPLTRFLANSHNPSRALDELGLPATEPGTKIYLNLIR
jgi:hypothetical protein